jgi:hypothetical protein
MRLTVMERGGLRRERSLAARGRPRAAAAYTPVVVGAPVPDGPLEPDEPDEPPPMFGQLPGSAAGIE